MRAIRILTRLEFHERKREREERLISIYESLSWAALEYWIDLENRKGRMVFTIYGDPVGEYVGLPDRSYHPTIGPFEYRGQIGGPDRPRASFFVSPRI